MDPDSVNSNFVEGDPSDQSDRLLVAAFVGTYTVVMHVPYFLESEFSMNVSFVSAMDSHSDRFKLRETTVMPRFLGHPALLALMFCPMGELR